MSLPRTGAEIREAFLSFFEERGHARLPSDSLVPANDPSLLFTGAGMNQFKDEFLGKGRSDAKRVATSQKCLRVPDLDNVGRTPRHHTFFEMLGNFSFGDYFKDETIPWEWEFFTSVLGWDGDRMVATVYHEDDEAKRIWMDAVNMPEERIFTFGEKENFWPAEAPSKGPNGPCGPCSELYYDLTPSEPLPKHEGLASLPGRFLEVGNFVFTQFNRQESGALDPLPQRNIDVGLGLERIAAVAQNAPNNFETDLFEPLLATIQEIAGKQYGRDSDADTCMRRIADHSRAVFFCIADGAPPSREGRGYVVRKILRRAVRDGIALGVQDSFLPALLPPLLVTMKEAYPQLEEHAAAIQTIAEGEEEQFREVFQKGIVRLESLLEDHAEGQFSGKDAFELHDTFGFPVDITQVVVEEAGFEFDYEGYEAAMNKQRERARGDSSIAGDVFTSSTAGALQSADISSTQFCGWDEDVVAATVVALLSDDSLVESLEANRAGVVVLDTTPFYPEGGGQVGDTGILSSLKGKAVFQVLDTKSADAFILHSGKTTEAINIGDEVTAAIQSSNRRATEIHHTATHLLHSALRRVVGEEVGQAGSLVTPDRLRFDYTTDKALSDGEKAKVEALVQDEITKNHAVRSETCSLDAAREEGAISLFGEKYGDEVRVVDVPEFSKELCGGTHVPHTGAIGLFVILSDKSLAAGVRRIEAIAGPAAVAMWKEDRSYLKTIESKLRVPREQLVERLESLIGKSRKADKSQDSPVPSPDKALSTLQVSGKLGWAFFPGVEAEGLRVIADSLRKDAAVHDVLCPVVLLVGGNQTSVPFAILSDLSEFPANELAKEFGKSVGGGGGGRADFAQGQGSKGETVENGAQLLSQSLNNTA